MPKLPLVDQLQRARKAHTALGARNTILRDDLNLSEATVDIVKHTNRALIKECDSLKAEVASLNRQITKLEKTVPKAPRRRSIKKDNDA